jgi:enoyl-[acyl-carrier protein] reductase II
MAAVFALGAEGIQVGSRFAACTESSAHDNFKNKIIEVGDGDTRMALRKLTPVRLIKNELSRKLEEAESTCSSNEEVLKILGRGRSKLGMFDGDLVEGELEIGQIAALINDIKPAAEIINDIINEYNVAINELKAF